MLQKGEALRLNVMTAIKNNREAGEDEQKKDKAGALYDFFVSIRFSMFILVLIAAGSILGTFIKQGADESEYLTLYTETTYKVIKFFGLDDAYHSFWFKALIVLFAINLTLCTLQRLVRFIKEKRQPGMLDFDRLSRMELNLRVDNTKKEEAISILKKSYRLIREEGPGLILEKGTLSRLGVFIIHGSIITVLIGSFIGLVFGYKGFLILRVGEIKDHVTARAGNHEEKALGFALKCKDFKASYYPGGQPKDYVSTIEVIEDGKKVQEKKIRVNDPLYYKGMRFYQSSYGKRDLFHVSCCDEEVCLRNRSLLRKKESCSYGGQVCRRQYIILGPVFKLPTSKETNRSQNGFFMNVDKMKSQLIQGVNVRLNEIREEPYTGLEVVRDPGVFVVWAGFALMLFGLYVNFFIYYRRVYVAGNTDGIIIAGYALKNKEAFGKEFEGLKEDIYGSAP